MNKILREEMEYLIKCDDKAITPDVKDDVSLTLQYIDELENKILELQQELLDKKLNIKDIEYKEKMIYKSRITKAIEYINNREWEDYPLQIAGHHKLKEEKEGKDLLEILRGDK